MRISSIVGAKCVASFVISMHVVQFSVVVVGSFWFVANYCISQYNVGVMMFSNSKGQTISS